MHAIIVSVVSNQEGALHLIFLLWLCVLRVFSLCLLRPLSCALPARLQMESKQTQQGGSIRTSQQTNKHQQAGHATSQPRSLARNTATPPAKHTPHAS